MELERGSALLSKVRKLHLVGTSLFMTKDYKLITFHVLQKRWRKIRADRFGTSIFAISNPTKIRYTYRFIKIITGESILHNK